MIKNNLNWGRVAALAGAYIAFLIGSGFATGQEVLQYFSSYGYKGIFGVLIVFILFAYIGINLITIGFDKKFSKGSDVYKYYCGNTVGTLYDYFSIAFIYMSFIVMIGGAGAAVNQQFGLPNTVGGVLMGVLAASTVVFGLGRIVDIIGKIGPLIVLMTIILSISAIVKNPEGLKTASTVIPELDLIKASTNWFFAAGSYVGFCMLWLAGFMTSLGASNENKKDGIYGAALGAAGFGIALVIVTLGIMANIEQIAGSMVPILVLAENVSPILALVFSFIVVAGIYTTAVPLLWQVVARFSEEKTSRFKTLTIILAIIGVVIGLLVPFDKLVNVIYVINGYVGIVLLGFMIIKTIRNRVEVKID